MTYEEALKVNQGTFPSNYSVMCRMALEKQIPKKIEMLDKGTVSTVRIAEQRWTGVVIDEL